MVAACPSCGVRNRVDPQELGPEGLRLRCESCRALFRVRPPRRTQETQAGGAVCVALGDAEQAKRVADALGRMGLEPAVFPDGVQALLGIQRSLPRAAILDVDLPRMDGGEICELVKRNESLRTLRIVLVGDAGRGAQLGAFGPEAWLEPGDLPDGLAQALRGLGFTLAEQPAPAAPAAPAAPEAPEDPELAKKRADAERLARIVISDVILYNPQKFEDALRSGNVIEAMEPQLAEGRALFARRVDPEIRGERDHLADELLRVAQEKGVS